VVTGKPSPQELAEAVAAGQDICRHCGQLEPRNAERILEPVRLPGDQIAYWMRCRDPLGCRLRVQERSR